MYVIVFLGQASNGQATLFVYGPYSSLSAAQQAAYNTGNAGAYTVAQVFTLPSGSSPPTPTTVSTGQFVLCQSVVNLLGVQQYNVFGAYGTLLAAQQAGLSLPYTGGQLASQVLAPI